METYQKELSQIKTILKNNPKGMTVTDIAHAIKINRNSVAKYLDVLLISGHAEMLTFGPAKVFFPSTRIPLSTILNFTHDYIALLNKDLRFVQINENLLNTLGILRDDIIGQPINGFTTRYFSIPEILQNAYHALEGKTLTVEKQYIEGNQTFHLRIQHIPIAFDDGEPGVTLIIEDITARRHSETTVTHALQENTILFNAITDMACITDADDVILRANLPFAKFFNLTPERCTEKKCCNLLHGREEPPATCPCAQMRLTKKPVTLQFFEPHLARYLEVSATPILTEDGKIARSVQIIKALPRPENEDKTGSTDVHL